AVDLAAEVVERRADDADVDPGEHVGDGQRWCEEAVRVERAAPGCSATVAVARAGPAAIRARPAVDAVSPRARAAGAARRTGTVARPEDRAAPAQADHTDDGLVPGGDAEAGEGRGSATGVEAVRAERGKGASCSVGHPADRRRRRGGHERRPTAEARSRDDLERNVEKRG